MESFRPNRRRKDMPLGDHRRRWRSILQELRFEGVEPAPSRPRRPARTLNTGVRAQVFPSDPISGRRATHRSDFDLRRRIADNIGSFDVSPGTASGSRGARWLVCAIGHEFDAAVMRYCARRAHIRCVPGFVTGRFRARNTNVRDQCFLLFLAQDADVPRRASVSEASFIASVPSAPMHAVIAVALTSCARREALPCGTVPGGDVAFRYVHG